MATIPLPALHAQPPAQSNPLEDYARIVNLKSALLAQQGQELQNQQVELASQDDQKWRNVMSSPDWDGSPDKLLKMGLKAGVGPKSYVTMQQGLMQAAKAHADLDEVSLKNEQTRNDQYRGQLLSILQAPDAQKQDLWDQAIARGEQAGELKPGTISRTYPGDDAAQTLANHFALGSTLAKEAIDNKTAEARQSQADTTAAEFAAKQNPQSPLYAPTPAATALGAQRGDPTAQAIQAWEAAQAGNVAGAQAKAKYPYELQLEQIRQQVAQQVSTNKDARDKIESTVLKPYEDKMSSIAQLRSAVQQAAQGNVTAARAVALKLIGVTNPDGTKRYNEAEANRLISQGNLPEQVKGSIKNLLTGDNWTDRMQSDMLSFGAAQGQVAADNLNRGIANVNRLYNTNVGQGLTQTLPRGNGRVIDKATAQQFYQAASGDPRKAQQLAEQNGWKVQ